MEIEYLSSVYCVHVKCALNCREFRRNVRKKYKVLVQCYLKVCKFQACKIHVLVYWWISYLYEYE